MEAVENIVESLGRRMVVATEIGFAIIKCSTEEYCNPSYDDKTTTPSKPETEPEAKSKKGKIKFTFKTIKRLFSKNVSKRLSKILYSVHNKNSTMLVITHHLQNLLSSQPSMLTPKKVTSTMMV